MTRTRLATRSGLSLLEVLIAAVILASTTLILVQLAYIGRSHSHSADYWSEARRLAENQLNAILIGLEPLENVSEQPIEDAPDWIYSTEIDILEISGMASITVTVAPADNNVTTHSRPPLTLVRWVRVSGSGSAAKSGAVGRDSLTGVTSEINEGGARR